MNLVRVARFGVLASTAGAEDFQPVAFNPETGFGGEVLDKLVDVATLKFNNVATFGADEMVPVAGTAEDVAVGAIRLVNPIENLKLDQHVDRPEDRCPANPGSPLPQIIVELLTGKQASPGVDLFDDFDTRIGDSQAGLFELVQRVA